MTVNVNEEFKYLIFSLTYSDNEGKRLDLILRIDVRHSARYTSKIRWKVEKKEVS